jgi:hypothetical protein
MFAELMVGAILVDRGARTVRSSLGGGPGSTGPGSPADPGAAAVGGYQAQGSIPSAVFKSGESFAKALLRAIGAPVTAGNVSALIAWQQAESPVATTTALKTDAAYNPLNTTLPAGPGGGTPINSDNVRAYATPTIGFDATVQTLLDTPAFAPIVDALRRGVSGAAELSGVVVGSKWGTGSFG